MHKRMFSGFNRFCPVNQAGVFQPDQGIFILTSPCSFLYGRKNEPDSK